MNAKNIVTIKWSGKEYEFTFGPDSNVSDMKQFLRCETNVLCERQKLMGLKCKGGVKLSDETKLVDCALKPSSRVMMMGSPETDIEEANRKPEDLPPLVDDFVDIDEDVSVENHALFLTRIEKRIEEYKIDIINEPREGKKLLVLDIDYTLFDHRSVAEKASELMRPFLHEFLTMAYPYYDIVIWSATGMSWVKEKMRQLGVLAHTEYKIAFMVDSRAMITIHTPETGTCTVKPLAVLWGLFPQWSAANTIMFDDIRRNFIMNPQSGLKIRPFRNAHQARATDRELCNLAQYLVDISDLSDFTTLNHRHWEKYHQRAESKRRRREKNASRMFLSNAQYQQVLLDDAAVATPSSESSQVGSSAACAESASPSSHSEASLETNGKILEAAPVGNGASDQVSGDGSVDAAKIATNEVLAAAAAAEPDRDQSSD